MLEIGLAHYLTLAAKRINKHFISENKFKDVL